MRLDTKAEHRRQIAALAAINFADHVLIEEAPGQWLCHRPGTGIYHFRVAQLRGALVVWGDIGDMIIANGRGSIGWFRGAQGSRDYVLSKSPTARRDEFMPGDFKVALFHYDRPALRRLAEEGAEFGELDYHEYLQDGGDCEIRPFDYNSNDHWCCEALAVFVRLLDQAEERAA